MATTPKDLMEQHFAAGKVGIMNMVSRLSGGAAALLLGLALAGCTSEAPQAKAPEVEAVVPDPPAAETESKPPVSERGNLVKALGEPAGVGPERGGENYVDFVVTAISTGAACTSDYALPSENGNYLRVEMEVATTAELPQDFLLNAGGQWKWIASNGTTSNADPVSGPAWGCLAESERLPGIVGKGERVAGALILDVPTTEGVLVFAQGSSSGWEWAVPAG